MPKIFISYRRHDSADATGRLDDRLLGKYGRESVFFDIDSIPPGDDFPKRLSNEVKKCDVLLAVIGDRWLDALCEDGPHKGKRRLEDPGDYVRIEIESALALGRPVIPVLVGQARMPAAPDLPGETLKDLAYKNAVEVRSGANFHGNVDRLIGGIETILRSGQAASQTKTQIAIVPKGLRSFDANDSSFFLELLPGPRDENGLPESIRLWKHRIESTGESAFTVGVLYGPSGCGKSSLIKAGLLPRLDKRVESIYIEATADDTEARLLKSLRSRFPTLRSDVDLMETIVALRQDHGLENNQKVLLVIDQFEQWLHAKNEEQQTELASSLRQCDGQHVQTILMVRDDFWVALSRFMARLQIELSQSQNTAFLDLFDVRHAKKVLMAFGVAFGAVPDKSRKDHVSFIDQAVTGLAQGGRVISVRLALFADMIKSESWTLATLKDVGGTEGVGVNFLEKTFSSPRADPRHRLHQKAACAVLKELLPEHGSDIKGNMRSRPELLEASGYRDRLESFEDLIHILDNEVRLITPTDPEGLEPAKESKPKLSVGQQYYQLTHDYLVPSLWEWLTRKQKETRPGRAQLRLADRSSVWNAKPENRLLPSVWEYLNIRLLSDKKNWTEPQRKMMSKAGRVHATRTSITAAVIAVVLFCAWVVNGEFQARSLVRQLTAAEISEVPHIVHKLDGYRHWAVPLLRQEDAQADQTTSTKLALALLPVDHDQISQLRDQLPLVPPVQFSVIRDSLLPYEDSVAEPLWNVALDSEQKDQQRFQAACALATYAPDDQRWSQIKKMVASHLVSLEASALVAWREALRPAKTKLIEPLVSIYRNTSQKEKEQARSFATETLADYAADQPEELFNLLADAEEFQFPVIFQKLARYKDEAVRLAAEEFARKPPTKATEDEKELLAKRQANVAVALLRLGTPEKVWPTLKFNPDPRVRSYIIHWLSPLGAEPATIIQRLETEPDVTIRRALVLMFGEFSESQISTAQRRPLIEQLFGIYEYEPDAGLHGAAEWVLRKWGQGKRLEAVVEKLKSDEKQMQARKSSDKRQWYVNSQKQTFVIVEGGEFLMGSPESELDRYRNEGQHRCRIRRRFAISAHEVTKARYRPFEKAVKGYGLVDNPEYAPIVRTDDSPQTALTWYEAAHYCDWLSEQEKIPREQWCYDPKGGAYSPGMKAKDRFWDLTGYRLPTEAEWEFACRAGTVTSNYYGLTKPLLPKYARYQENGQNRAWPVGGLKPNDLGLFDMLGNAFEWCFDHYGSYPEQNGKIFEDTPSTRPDNDADRRVLRGGAFANGSVVVRSAYRYDRLPVNRSYTCGFRPARTLP